METGEARVFAPTAQRGLSCPHLSPCPPLVPLPSPHVPALPSFPCPHLSPLPAARVLQQHTERVGAGAQVLVQEAPAGHGQFHAGHAPGHLWAEHSVRQTDRRTDRPRPPPRAPGGARGRCRVGLLRARRQRETAAGARPARPCAPPASGTERGPARPRRLSLRRFPSCLFLGLRPLLTAAPAPRSPGPVPPPPCAPLPRENQLLTTAAHVVTPPGSC